MLPAPCWRLHSLCRGYWHAYRQQDQSEQIKLTVCSSAYREAVECYLASPLGRCRLTGSVLLIVPS